MAKKFAELRSKMSPESRARVERRVQEALTAMPINELRKARELTQMAMAERLGVAQGEVSKIERRTDVYLSTLREYVEALGGELVLRAEFPDGSVNIDLHK
ncbi:MAG: XRE family transcriptional regulator [Acidobacteria bacterium]|nr:XRE family transcriptional regulator [Acidobacteriota bacterium]